MGAGPRVEGRDAAAPELTGRLFVALWPDDAVRRGLATLQSAVDWPAQARPVPARDLHLTLAFIGAVPVGRLADLQALDLRSPAFELVIDTFERWRGGLAVLTPSRPPPALQRWQAALAQALRRLELRVDERPYAPHVTIARRSGGAQPRADRPLVPVTWPAAGGCLAVRDGAHYRVLRRGGGA